jgi:hypothetical protein
MELWWNIGPVRTLYRAAIVPRAPGTSSHCKITRLGGLLRSRPVSVGALSGRAAEPATSPG